jgi:hypothetical protein
LSLEERLGSEETGQHEKKILTQELASPPNQPYHNIIASCLLWRERRRGESLFICKKESLERHKLGRGGW